jgi:ribosome-binding factor A
MSQPEMKGPSQRMLRVGELIRHAVSDILSRGEVMDPDLERQIITVPEVRMSPDLKVATVFVMPLGGKNQDKIVKALNRNAKWLRGQIARRVEMKFAADVRFKLDTRFDDDAKIETLLKSDPVARDIDPAAKPEDGTR